MPFSSFSCRGIYWLKQRSPMTYQLVRVEGHCPVCQGRDGVLWFYIRYDPAPLIVLYVYVHRPLICGRTGRLIYTSGICSRGL